MGSMKKTQPRSDLPLFFEDKPLFGLDIGHSSIRVMQVADSKNKSGKKKARVLGYGVTSFDPSAVADGVIERPETLAEAIQVLFRKNLIGNISTKRVAMSVPVAHAFTRSVEVPKMSAKQLEEMVQTEVEQYIPASAESLYIDYARVKDAKGKTSVFIVAMPRKIVDSYVVLARMLGLETIMIETSSGAGAHLFSRDAQSDIPAVLVDFGSDSADITIYDKNPLVSGTAAFGGETVTKLIAKALGVSEKEAILIKSRYGLTMSKKQKEIIEALKPTFGLLTHEIRRTLRYFDEHKAGEKSISQVIVMGGGANMPGLASYLTSELRIAVRSIDPSSYLDFGRLQPLSSSERMSYVTAAGLALYSPAEVSQV